MTNAVDDFKYPPKPVSWNERDLLVFANSIGCKEDELQYLYENHPSFQPFPTYPVILQYKGTATSTVDYYKHGRLPSPLLPFPDGARPIDATRSLDGQRKVHVVKQLPVTSANRQFELRTKLLGMYDKGKAGTVVESESVIADGDDVYCRIVRQSFAVGQGGWGGPKGPSTPEESVKPPEREKDLVVKVQTSEGAARLYRLNGDYNPLHVDPTVAQKAGYPRPILHGLCTWNTVACALLRSAGKGKTLREFQARFASVVYPGDTLVCEVWKMGTQKGGEEWRFVTKVEENGKLVLSNGRMVLGGGEGGSKL